MKETSAPKQTDKTQGSSSESMPACALPLNDKRAQTLVFTQMKSQIQNSLHTVTQRHAFDAAIGNTAASKPNQTGMPDHLKAGLENLSGFDLSDVKVHYNSPKPAQLQAFAYAQGNEIHLGHGQEKHLPHEGWHVVQQKQGRVKPTMQMKGMAANDDGGLEKEADVMGAKALSPVVSEISGTIVQKKSNLIESHPVVQRAIATDKLNVIGENHDESDTRRDQEINYSKKIIDPEAGYWREDEFTVSPDEDLADPVDLRLADLLKRLEKHISVIGTTVDKLINYSPSDQKKLLGTIRNGLQIAMDIYFGRLVPEITKILKLKKAGKYPLTGKMQPADFAKWAKETLKYKKAMATMISRIDDCLKDEEEFSALWPDLQNLCLEVNFYAFASINDEYVLKDDFTAQRSWHMHIAASLESDKAGIWKIGQQHVEDIKKLEKGKLDYNLVTRSEFNYYLEYPTPSEASKLGLFDKKKKNTND